MARNRPLISTLVALFCLYGVLVAGTAWEQSRGRHMTLQMASLAIERQAAAISEEIDRALLSLDLMLMDAATVLADGTMADAQRALRRHVPYVPSGTHVGFYDAAGRLADGGRPAAQRPPDISQSAYYRRHRDDGVLAITLRQQMPAGDGVTLGLSRAVVDDRGTFQGVLVAIVDSEVAAGFAAEQLDPLTPACILITDGTATDALPGSQGCSPTAQAMAPAHGRGTDSIVANDHVARFGTVTDVDPERLVALHSMRSFPLAVLLSRSLAEVMAPWRERAIVWGMALAASGIALVIFAGWVVVLERSRMRLSLKVREEEITRRQAEEANRLKSQFLSKMSHEFRTPLNAILGFAEMIKGQILGPLENQKYIEYANDIYFSGAHLLSIVNDFLELSRIEAGRVELAPEVLHVRSEVAMVLRMIKQKAEAKGVQVRFESIPGDALAVADQRALRQILLNLVSNAVKFTGAGGRIDIELDQGAGDCDHIRVRDTGCGVPAAQLHRIMQPFEQVRGEGGPSAEGTGLGLPIVKSLVELHGGSFVLASEVGVGTTATVILPRPAANSDVSVFPELTRASA